MTGLSEHSEVYQDEEDDEEYMPKKHKLSKNRYEY